MISTSRTSDFQISGSAISSHKNIHLTAHYAYFNFCHIQLASVFWCIMPLKLFCGSLRAFSGLNVLYNEAVVCVFRLSVTRIIFSVLG